MYGLENQDCLEFLRSLEDESVDLILADPPYFKIIADAWDNQWTSEKRYLEWCKAWTTECVRVLKPNRCMYVWGTTKTNTFLRYKLDVLESFPQMNYQNWIIWAYDWGGRTKKTFPRKHEDILMYSKGKTFPFNDEFIRVPYKMKANIRKSSQNHPNGKIPTDVWTKNNHTTSKEYCGWHPAQKPISHLERIILANSYPGDVVLDIFSGTGSTAVACHRTGRTFIGCEVSKEYYHKSIKRIEDLCDLDGAFSTMVGASGS